MLFGFRFLKQVLFGENTIAMRQETPAKRIERAKERMRLLEAEAQARRAQDADGMYEIDEQ